MSLGKELPQAKMTVLLELNTESRKMSAVACLMFSTARATTL
jgi:hypothetical protein